MARSAILTIKILTDARDATKGLDKSSTEVQKFNDKMRKGAGVAAGIAIAGVGAFAVAAGKAASDVQQSMGAVDSVFGDSADQIKKWSDTSATSVGLSKTQYGELASVIGAQLRNMGVPLDQVASKTNDLVTMGADLAATFGGTTAEAVEALGSALRGETDPIERYGISIKQADIAARQAKDGTAGLEGEAGKAAKTAALLALATEQAGGATGQFARETDSAAGSQQIATAQWEDAKAALGEALLPAMVTLAGVLSDVAGAIKEHPTLFYAVAGAIVAMSVAILALNAVTAIQTALTTAFGAAAVAAWWAALWPILLVIAAIALVVGAVILLWKKCDWFRNGVLAVWDAIRSAFAAVVGWITTAWKTTVAALAAAVAWVRDKFTAAWTAIRTAAAAVMDWLKGAWAAVWGVLSAAAAPFVAAFKLAFDLVAAVARVVGDVVKEIWRVVFWAIQFAAITVRNVVVSAFRAVMGPVKAAAAVVRGVWQTVFGWIKTAVAAVRAVIVAAFNAVMGPIRAAAAVVKSVVSAAFRAISEVARSVTATIRRVWDSVFGALKRAASGLGDLLSKPFDVVRNAVDAVVGAVRDLIGWLGRIKVPKISLPKLPGLNATATVTTTAPVAAGARSAAPTTTASSRSAAGVVININGAVDPEGTARQVRRLLAAHDLRVGTGGSGLRAGTV